MSSDLYELARLDMVDLHNTKLKLLVLIYAALLS